MIIQSLTETDAYKPNMQQVVLHQFNQDIVSWAFRCRNANVKFTPRMISRIREEIDDYCHLRFKEDELKWLKTEMPWLKQDYIDFLRFWHPRREEILVNEDNIQAYNDCGLAIEAHGTWLNTMMYEIPILAIVNQVFFEETYGKGAKNIEFQKRTMENFAKLRAAVEPGFTDYCEDYKREHPYEIGTFSEFGLRRRYSSEMQDWLINFICESKIPGFVGTSNVYLARKYQQLGYKIKPVGTQAHEFFMAQQGHFEHNPAYSNMFAMKAWTKEYETKLGIALTDTLGTNLFLKDFGETYATLFSGVRHDSGDPIVWGENMIAHYKKLGIAPETKTLLFSDALNFEKATKIYQHFRGRVKVAFGIGTSLSNPLDNPLNIVFKMTECNGSPVAKISNDPSKGMCRDARYEDYLKRSIEWRFANR